MYEVFTVYKTMPEFQFEVESEDEAIEAVAELKTNRLLDDAYYMPA